MNGHTIRQPLRLATSLFFALLLLLPACGGGGSSVPDPNPYAPTVLNVFPKDLSARSGSTIRFIAQLDKPASSYLWDFGDGAIPTTTTTATEFQPLVILDAPGTYTATLTVCAAECADPFTFTYIVTPDDVSLPRPRIQQVEPNGLAGARGKNRVFSAVVEGAADTWSWDFGLGTQPRFSTESTPEVLLFVEGVHTGQLSVGQAGGAIDTLPFAYEISAGVLEIAPEIVTIVPSKTLWACDGKNINFTATSDSETPETFEWAFEGGVTPLISSNSVARLHTLNVEGFFEGSVRARNQFGVSPPKSFQFSVVQCPDVILEQRTGNDRMGGSIFLDATINGPFYSLRRDIDPWVVRVKSVDNKFELLTEAPAAISGEFSARRFRSWGTGDITPFHITVPSAPGPPPAWSSVYAKPLTIDYQSIADIELVAGKPVLVFYDRVTHWIRYVEAINETPVQQSDWREHNISVIATDTVKLLSLNAQSPTPVIVSQDASTVRLHVGLTPTPTTGADWSTLNVEPLLGSVDQVFVVSNSGGNLLLMVQPKDSTPPKALQTINPSPVSLADIEVTDSFTNDPDEKIIAAHSWADRWLIASLGRGQQELRLARARVTRPQSADEWVGFPITDLSIGWTSYHPSLASTESRAWLFMSPTPSTTGDPMEWWSTTEQAPDTAASWQHLEPAYGFPSQAEFCALGGRLFGMAKIAPRFYSIRSVSQDGDAGADWYKQLNPSLGEFKSAGDLSALLPAGNRLYMVISDAKGVDNNDALLVCSTTISW